VYATVLAVAALVVGGVVTGTWLQSRGQSTASTLKPR